MRERELTSCEGDDIIGERDERETAQSENDKGEGKSRVRVGALIQNGVIWCIKPNNNNFLLKLWV